MYRFTWLVLVAMVSAYGAAPAAAQDRVVAGWDFSQYQGAGAATADGTTLATSLPANYSDFDPTYGSGAEAAAFGTMFVDGSNGSSLTSGSDFGPTTARGSANKRGPANGVPAADAAFDAFNVLASEGQTFQSDVSVVSTQQTNVVFRADRTGGATAGNRWKVAFGAQWLDAPSALTVEFGAGSPSYSLVRNVNLTPSDTRYEVQLGESTENIVFVRLGLPAGSDTVLDNVTIAVPEAAAGCAAWAALGALGVFARTRRPR